MRKPTVLIVCPHPDDGEWACGTLTAQSIKAGWNVHELLMTTDEYGTTRNDFKGFRIKRIRKAEMIHAAKMYGVDEQGNSLLKLHWANYIDGFTPFTKKSVNRLQRFIQKIKPDIIVGPDPFVYFDAHVDHIATGKNYYFTLKSMNPETRPKIMLFFHSLMPDFFLPIMNPDILHNARKSHKSQWTEKNIKFFTKMKILYPFQWINATGGKNADGYRKVTFSSDHRAKGFAKIVSFLFNYKGYKEDHFIPRPEELNLDLHPEGDIT